MGAGGRASIPYLKVRALPPAHASPARTPPACVLALQQATRAFGTPTPERSARHCTTCLLLLSMSAEAGAQGRTVRSSWSGACNLWPHLPHAPPGHGLREHRRSAAALPGAGGTAYAYGEVPPGGGARARRAAQVCTAARWCSLPCMLSVTRGTVWLA